MSQFYVNISEGNLPPSVPTDFTTDVKDNTIIGPGNAVPSGQNIVFKGRQTDQNNDFGIRTDADPDADKYIYVELTNRITGSGTTDTVTTTLDLVSFDLGSTAGVYYFEGSLIGFDKTSVQGASYPFQFSARTDGTATGGLEIGSNFINEIEEPGFTYNNIDVEILAGTNTLLVRVVGNGINTVDWDTILTYRFVG